MVGLLGGEEEYFPGAESMDRGPASVEEALRNPQVLKLLQLATYGSVSVVFLLMLFRLQVHLEHAAAIEAAGRRAATNFVVAALMVGDGAGFALSALRLRRFKPYMKVGAEGKEGGGRRMCGVFHSLRKLTFLFPW